MWKIKGKNNNAYFYIEGVGDLKKTLLVSHEQLSLGFGVAEVFNFYLLCSISTSFDTKREENWTY